MAKTNTTTNVTVNNATTNTTIKEENIMMKRMEEIAQQLANNQKVQDAGYLKKDELMVILNDEFNLGLTKKYSRARMVEIFFDMYKDTQNIADEIAYGNIETTEEVTIASPVPVGDLDITNDNAPQQNETRCYGAGSTACLNNCTGCNDIENKHIEAKAKTDKLFALIKSCAIDNYKKGFGYTISSYMLQACILNAGAGIPKLKGHTVTVEENLMTQGIYLWLKNKGYVKPLVYSVVEDDKVRVYTSEYKGKTDTKHVKMIPWDKSAGYTAKKVTSFLVCFK